MSIRDTKKKLGRPATGKGTPVTLRLQPDMLAALDTLIDGLPEPKPSRPEAIRQVLATALNFVARDDAMAPSSGHDQGNG